MSHICLGVVEKIYKVHKMNSNIEYYDYESFIGQFKFLLKERILKGKYNIFYTT